MITLELDTTVTNVELDIKALRPWRHFVIWLLAKIDLTFYHLWKSQMPFQAEYKMAAMVAILNFMVAKINRILSHTPVHHL